MNEYDIKKALAQRSGQLNNEKSAAVPNINGIPNSVLTEVFAGKRKATNEMMGRRSELAPSIAAKLSRSFGMDVSNVQVYRSDAMKGTGMHGMAQGNKVVLSSDVDLNTMEGQAILGHELSHVRAQSMGIGTGSGLLQNAALEHQADTEGMLAARGMSISGESLGMSMGLGMAGMEGLQPIGAGLSATAAAPMQAEGFKDFFTGLFGGKKKSDVQSLDMNEVEDFALKNGGGAYNYLDHIPKDKEYHYDNSKPLIDQVSWLHGPDDHPWQKDDQDSPPKQTRTERLLGDLCQNMKYQITFGGGEYSDDPKEESSGVYGLSPDRIISEINHGLGSEFDDDYIKQMFENMSYGMTEKDAHTSSKYNKRRLEGAMMYKEILYYQLKQEERKYGTLLHDMHPDDINQRMGVHEKRKFISPNQDARQFNQSRNGEKVNKALQFKDKKKEADYWRLFHAFDPAQLFVSGADIDLMDRSKGAQPIGFAPGQLSMYLQKDSRQDPKIRKLIKNGPKMKGNQLKEYQNDVKKKEDSGQFQNFGKAMASVEATAKQLNMPPESLKKMVQV